MDMRAPLGELHFRPQQVRVKTVTAGRCWTAEDSASTGCGVASKHPASHFSGMQRTNN